MMLWALFMGFLVANTPFKSWMPPLPATQSTSVPEGTVKLRVDAYLSQVFPQYSRSQIGDLCEQGAVMVNAAPKAKNYKVKGGDAIAFEVASKEVMNVAPEDIPLTVLYEDDYIVAVNKAAGMCVHPGPGNPNGTFVNALLHHVGTDLADGLMEARYGPGPGNDGAAGDGADGGQVATYTELAETPEESRTTPQLLRPGIVHRLDKGTSGVLLAGKTTEAVAALSALFASREIEKVYMACCVGHPGDSTIMEPIGRDRKNRQLMTVYDEDEEGPPGKPAVSHTKTFAFDGKLSAALVRIETGRTHQIRVHLKHRRTPIIGDEQYGNADWNKRVFKAYGVNRPLLHAYQIAFKHPFTGEALCLQAPVPADMADMLSRMDAQASAVPVSELCNPLLDRQSGLLTVDTAVAGQAPKGSRAAERGFVPLDRLSTQGEDEFVADLPEEMAFWRDKYGYGYGDAGGGSG